MSSPFGTIQQSEQWKQHLIEKTLMNTNKIDIKTELNDIEILDHSFIQFCSEYTKQQHGFEIHLAKLIEKVERRKLSKNRKSREELVTIMKQQPILDETKGDKIKKVLGFI